MMNEPLDPKMGFENTGATIGEVLTLFKAAHGGNRPDDIDHLYNWVNSDAGNAALAKLLESTR